MISIKGIQKVDGEQEVIELLTCGRFYRRNNSYWLSYQESETTGFEGHRTTLRVEPNRVTMQRRGPSSTQLIVEGGCRHQCFYNTGYGALTVGINGRTIRSTLTDDGGELDFSYAMDINTALTSENQIIIRVDVNEKTVPPPQ